MKLLVGKPSPLTVTVARCVPTGAVRLGPTPNVALPPAAMPEIVISDCSVFVVSIVPAVSAKLLAPAPESVIVRSPVTPLPGLSIRVDIAALFTLKPA